MLSGDQWKGHLPMYGYLVSMLRVYIVVSSVLMWPRSLSCRTIVVLCPQIC